MLGKSEQIFFNETLSAAAPNLPYLSRVLRLDNYTNFILAVTVANAPQGTSPTLQFEILTSPDGVNFSQVGAGPAPLTSTLLCQSTDYGATTAQGAITGPYFRISALPAGAGAVFTGVYADIVAQV